MCQSYGFRKAFLRHREAKKHSLRSKRFQSSYCAKIIARLACENIRFSSLFVAEDVSLSRRPSSARNVPSDEERGETDVFAGYCPSFLFFLLSSQLSRLTRAETLATQAKETLRNHSSIMFDSFASRLCTK